MIRKRIEPYRNSILHQEPMFKAIPESEPEEYMKPGKSQTTKMAPAELEKMLQKQFGNRLEPIRKYNKPPTLYSYKETPGYKREIQNKHKSNKKPMPHRIIEPAILQPKHLTGARFRELIAAGKSNDEIFQMYRFSTNQYFNVVLRKIGCSEFIKHGGRPKKDIKKDR